MHCFEPVFNVKRSGGIPSCADLGLRASQQGDFQTARQMMRAALEQLTKFKDEPVQIRSVELITCIADMHLHEGRYESAKLWYSKALYRAQSLSGAYCLHAHLLCRLAELSVLQAEMSDFRRYFDNLVRLYLLSQEADVSVLLSALIELSWVLCVNQQSFEAKAVNNLISQINTIEREGLADCCESVK